jgi:hypothetical protein
MKSISLYVGDATVTIKFKPIRKPQEDFLKLGFICQNLKTIEAYLIKRGEKNNENIKK